MERGKLSLNRMVFKDLWEVTFTLRCLQKEEQMQSPLPPWLGAEETSKQTCDENYTETWGVWHKMI